MYMYDLYAMRCPFWYNASEMVQFCYSPFIELASGDTDP